LSSFRKKAENGLGEAKRRHAFATEGEGFFNGGIIFDTHMLALALVAFDSDGTTQIVQGGAIG